MTPPAAPASPSAAPPIAPIAAITPARWARLNPLLDELLDLDAPARQARLAALRLSAGDDGPALADDLAALLQSDAALAEGNFLAQPALPDLASLSTPPELAGQAVGPYTLVRLLGEGGMGSVWLARRSDGRFEGDVAIKFLRAGLLGAGDAGRFAREGAILARLAHPHIARLLDAGVARGGTQPYLVLEHVDGEPIDRWCEAHALDTHARVRLLLDVLGAVAHAHNRLILHRDLKPSNIQVTTDGQAKLLDFGIAKLLDDASEPAAATELTQRVGAAYTPRYAAPEQVQGGDVTTATDVYALGVLMYALLGGGHPTTDATATPVDQLRTVVEVAPRRLSDAVRQQRSADAPRRARELRGDLDTIVAKALKKAPTERYANAAALADDLQRWLKHEPIAARPDSRGYRLARFAQRNRGGVAAGLLVLMSLAGGLGVAVWQGIEAQRQRTQAEALIAFMLGDLRDRLAPVGRLDVLDAVGDQVLRHYAAMASGAADAGIQLRRANALVLLGDVAEKRRQLESAARRYDQAAAITEALLARRPNDRATIAAHVEALSAVYDLQHLRGHRAALPPLMATLRPLADRLRAIDPNNLDWRWLDAMQRQRQGVQHLDDGALDAALTEFRAAELLLTPCVAAKPALHIDLAQVLGYLSRAMELQNNFPGALAMMQAKGAALQRMPNVANDLPSQVDLVSTTSELARLSLAQGDQAAAERGYAEVLARSDALLARDDSNQMWQRQAINVRINLGQLALARQDWAGAAPLNAEALARLHRVLDQPQPERFFRLVLLGHALAQSGQLALGDPVHHPPAEALPALDQHINLVRSLEAQGQALDINEQRALGLVLLAQGDLQNGLGRTDKAQTLWRDITQRLADAPARHDVARMLILGEARARLGDHAGAQAMADAVAAMRPQSQLLAQLRRRLNYTAPSQRREKPSR